MTMDWQRLVSTKRLGRTEPADVGGARTEFLKDWDRIVYSSALRRMQDKAQVFPLSGSDYVRTRLTHSLEVSSVGRSLGMLCGEFVLRREPGLAIGAQDFGNIVAAACLAHDIGNPPFGHSGEDAIQSWFNDEGAPHIAALTPAQQADFCKFEGNAQGFRLITRLQNAVNHGGFQLTHAVLATYAKYPRGSILDGADKRRVSEKKFGYYDDDAANFALVAQETGLPRKDNGAHARHPLAFLMEAADDICYAIVDLEDGHRMGRVSFADAKDLMAPIAGHDDNAPSASYSTIVDDSGKLEYLRARAIGKLIHAVVAVFHDNYETIMEGRFEQPLARQCVHASELEAILTLSRQQIYSTPAVLQIEAAGYQILGGLLAKFVPAVLSPPEKRSRAHQKIVQNLPAQFLSDGSDYQKLLGVTDYISGMTDTYALTLFRRLHGIELPGNAL